LKGVTFGTTATTRALTRHGLLVDDFSDRFTDAGRAWIAEQIEAARDEALAMNQLSDWRRQGYMQPLSRGGSAATAPFGGSHYDAQRVERDHAEALAMNVERVEVGADGCGCPITGEITASGADVEGTDRTEHRPGCWNTPATADVPLARTGGDGPRYPNVRVSGGEIAECTSITAVIALVRRTLAEEIGADVARDFAEVALDAYGMHDNGAELLRIVRAWVTVA
jgi:hypothetical protein